ncbi:MAG TPA: hypothetical protein VG167_07835 [Verrucomicrobiae bacterium]|nr:hypothetical protein [Verrucomicrobiae bacterium]
MIFERSRSLSDSLAELRWELVPVNHDQAAAQNIPGRKGLL